MKRSFIFSDDGLYGSKPQDVYRVEASSYEAAWRKFLDKTEPRWADNYKNLDDAIGNYADQVSVVQVGRLRELR